MKKIILLALLFSTSFIVNAQKGFYVSLGAGHSYKASEQKMSNTQGAEKNSYGEGTQLQLKGGYLFDEKFGVELSVGYLHGDDQKILQNDVIEAYGRARAYGASLSGLYNITKNVYVRGGLLTKIGGKTEVLGKVNVPFPDVQNSYKPALLTVNSTRSNVGHIPLGFVAAFGAKINVTDNISLFAEMEYQGINVSANKSTLDKENFKASINGKSYTNTEILAQIQGFQKSGNPDLVKAAQSFRPLLAFLVDEYKYVDEPTKLTEVASLKVPYSSFGLVFGINYSFN